MNSDPNKVIFSIDPHLRPDSYWGDNLSEIQLLLKTPSFDTGHGRSSNLESQKKFWEYTINHADINSGLWLEFGVMGGRSINFISDKINTTIYGFDSFEGLPEDWYDDTNFGKKGTFSQEGKVPNVNNNVKLIPGWYENTVPSFVENLNENEYVSFLHIDCDIYSSTKIIFDNFAPLIRSGTVIMFDEYWYNHRWDEHEFKAFQEFVNEYKIKYNYIANTHRGLASLKIL